MRVTKRAGVGGQVVSGNGLEVQKFLMGREIRLKSNEIEVMRMFRGGEVSKDV